MANIFEKVRDYLNQPLPGAPGSQPKAGEKTAPKITPVPKAGTTTTAKPGAEQQKAPDVHAELRKRDLQIRRARARADAARRAELDKQRKELDDLRRKYEAEMAAEAKVHADRTEWTHTVAPGDTLSGIAKKYYGNAARWPEILNANKDKIKNPNLIYPGQVFVIPDND